MRFAFAVMLAPLLLLSACALYPVPEDVARLSTVQIVQQIRCEVREALQRHAYIGDRSRLTEQNVDKAVIGARETSRLNTIFEQITRVREKNIQMIHNEAYLRTRDTNAVKTADEFDKIIKLTAENAKIQCELDHVGGCGEEKAPSLSKAMRKAIKDTYVHSSCATDEFMSMDKLLREVVNEISTKEREVKKKSEDQAIGEGKTPEEAEAIGENAAIQAASHLAGLRYVSDRRRIVIEAIDCFRQKHKYYQSTILDWRPECKDQKWIKQCRAGVKPPNAGSNSEKEKREQRITLTETGLDAAFKDVALGYGFDFRMTDKDTSSIGLDFSMPLSKGSFVLGASFSEEKIRANTRTFDLSEEVSHLMADTAACDVRSANWRYPLTGEIGIERTVKSYADLASIAGFFTAKKAEKGDSSKATEFTDQLEFTTDIAGGPSPVLSLNAVPNQFRLVKVTPKISLSRKDVHKLTITFVKGERAKTDVLSDTLYPDGFDPPPTDTISCAKDRCTSGSGAVLNFRPQIPNLQGTIRCINKVCSIEAPIGASPTDKALNALERKRSEDIIRRTIREELGTQ